MATMPVDTLSLARELRAADLPQAHAEAIAAAIGRSTTESVDSLATKGDLALLRSDLASVEARVETKIETAQKTLTAWFVGSQLAVGALVVAALKL